jgi:hypothetical protein
MASQPIKINGRTYDLDALNPTAKTMLGNLRSIDRKLAELKQEIALLQIARESCGKTLLANLPEPADGDAPAAEPSPQVTLN